MLSKRVSQVIHVGRFGGLANRMFRYMFADLLSRRTGFPITGYDMPEWGLVSSELQAPAGHSIATGRVHQIDVDAFLAAFETGTANWIDVDCYAMRLEYFQSMRTFFANIFASSVEHEFIADDEIAISIRSGDIVNGLHPNYMPLPIAFYRRVVFETGLKPAFVGQVSGNWYTDALRRHFPDARFVEGKSAISDFQTIREAKVVMNSVSSFSWLASFLSDRAKQVHVPVAGLFDRRIRPDVNLLPIDDSRYCFHEFQPGEYKACDYQREVLVSRPAWASSDRHPRQSFLGFNSATEKPRIRSKEEVALAISTAVDKRHPFSFVRLGDGEGNLLQFDEATAAPIDHEYFRGHFGDSASSKLINNVREGLKDTLQSADLIGVRDDIWLSTNVLSTLDENDPEFYRRFRDEFPLRRYEKERIDEYSARRVFRLFSWARDNYPTDIDACSQWVCYDLAISKFWKMLIARLPSIGIVHCSPTLPAKVVRATGARVESYLVPDKASNRAQWGSVLPPDCTPHYPDIFLQTCERLKRAAQKSVFLVGAGLAGKEYLRIIKDNGGVALDLGALLDAWDGRVTRPNILTHKTSNRWKFGDEVPSQFLVG